MTLKQLTHRFGLLVLALLGLFAIFLVLARPWYLRWGASGDELIRSLPGDEIVPIPRMQATRAITINAPVFEVWPWVAQLGQDRGGFYSYELREDLAGCEMTNSDRIHSEFQDWKIGDKLWMYPPERLAGIGHAELRALHPGTALGFATRHAR
jgi:hypothetical protein